ncbi:hypothetical protein PVAP13_2NG336189 [Panicum virgatum]|uniref:Uncharacterized protein n=1 Tax=Panicum virgatum TaxID=38727 RepID=A0A8T0VUM9_PANVG|nr:hypothetical protein PVAP13_2NG336189 [Panicum virgatum]
MVEVAGGCYCKICARRGLLNLLECPFLFVPGWRWRAVRRWTVMRRTRFCSVSCNIQRGPLIRLMAGLLGESSTRSLYRSTIEVVLCIALLPESVARRISRTSSPDGRFPLGALPDMELLSPMVPWSRSLLLCQCDVVQA